MKVLIYILGLTLLSLSKGHNYDKEEHQTLIQTHETNVVAVERSINNFIDVLLRKCLEKVRSVIKNKEPYPIPDYPPQQISDQNVQVNITLTNVKENYASSFVLNKLQNSFFAMTEYFDITFPQLEFFGNYVVNGAVLRKAVHGKGDFTVWMTNLHTWGTAYAHIVNDYVQLRDLKIDYKVQNVTATTTGLTVEGLSQQEVQFLLNHALLQYFTNNERVVCDTISKTVLTEVNGFLYGMTLSDLIDWLRHFLNHQP